MDTLIDHTSLAILDLLSQNSRMPIKDISKKVALSEPSVKKRIDRMIDMGIIKGFTTKIHLPNIGYKIIFFTKVSELSIPNSIFQKKIKETKEFIECYSVTGKENFILKGVAEDIQQVESILNELTSFSKIETSIILEEINLENNLLH